MKTEESRYYVKISSSIRKVIEHTVFKPSHTQAGCILNLLLKLNNKISHDFDETLAIEYLGEVCKLACGAKLACMFGCSPRLEIAMKNMWIDGSIYGLAFKEDDVFHNFLVVGRTGHKYIIVSKKYAQKKPEVSSISIEKLRTMKDVVIVAAHTMNFPTAPRGPFNLPVFRNVT
jgi:hypothetical protein